MHQHKRQVVVEICLNIITDEAALLGLPNGSAFRGEERMANKR